MHDFFESLTRTILKATHSSNTRLAGDGTVIEAAVHYNLLKEEAVRVRSASAVKAVEHAPDDAIVHHEQQNSQQCEEIFEQRLSARHSHGKSGGSLRIRPTEPEAMVQRLKRGHGFAPSYKPSVLANED